MSVFSRFFTGMRTGAHYIRQSRVSQTILFFGMCGLGVFLRRFYAIEEMDNKDESPENSDGSSRPLRQPANYKPAGTETKLTRAGVQALSDELSNFKTLADYGYAFNEAGELRNLKNGERFEFKVKEDQRYNQKRYEAIGELITEHVYERLENEVKLTRVQVPVDASEGDPSGFVFASQDYNTNTDKLLILIHGSGVVRAGQWARRLIINNDVSCGTQLPYIKRAMEEGYAVMVLNSNQNNVEVNGKKKGIRGNTRPEEHGVYVWGEIIKDLPAKNIAIVAHSYGGIVTTHMANHFTTDFENRVFAIAFTDSVHSLDWQQAPEGVHDLFTKKAINWVTSDEPLDTPVRTPKRDAPCWSAGHDTHEWTSHTAMGSIFDFFNRKYPSANADL